ncbi:hypothetical protein [Pedobacter frigoris]|uniref:hypothetical protein n=1 Tax=Pedobacter frigoris TaxID=2571272 RepID=UPI00292F36F4|nr:hypothetical protein [Pedobacter frigoris]
MKAQVFSHEKHIGTTELRLGDESMDCLYGNFIPTENYYKYVQRTVWDFWSKTKPDYDRWAAMKFNVQLDNGYFLFAEGGFTIDDIKELQNEPKRIDIAGVDRHVIEDFFLQIQPRPFTEDPWESISIDRKIAFEKELRKELGIYESKSFWNSFAPKKNLHILADFQISALCRNTRNDDVLFITKRSDDDEKFAVVHLTWKKAKEVDNYPHIQFYDSFDEFKYNRMYPDKVDWES